MRPALAAFPRLALPFLLCGISAAQAVHITGTVVDSAGSAGIGGASATLLESPGLAATTGPSGAFTLTGAIPVRQRAIGASGSVLLRSGRMTLRSAAPSRPVSVDAYAGDGTRVFHAARTTDAEGNLELADMWRAPGRYSVVLEMAGREYRFSRVDPGNGGGQWVDLRKTARKAPLAKTDAAYTLQVKAEGYLTKNIALTSADTALGVIRMAHGGEATGVWTDVTPPGMANDPSGFGPGSIAGDPLRPSDMYVGGSESGVWKSADYGKTWKKINALSPDITRGCILAVAPTTPATVYVAGFGRIFKSKDAGLSFDTLSTGGFDPYSFAIDPYDPGHLLSGLHEAPDVIESVDGGASWHKAGTGSVGGGVSVYPFFIDMGNAAATRTTWLAIAQNGSSPGRTTDGGKTWATPAGLAGLEHPHGNAKIFQQGANLWVGGAYDFRGTILRSADYGVTWSKVTASEKPEALVWGTRKNVYAMYAWACSGCDVQANFAHAPLPAGADWTYQDSTGLKIGPNTVAVADDGTHAVIVGLMWAEGLWRYVEP
jgi:photosystem II stability/assembly factor-like uncharacterized protein